MLLTMGELYKEKHEAMPSPERIDKVMSLLLFQSLGSGFPQALEIMENHE